jgi:hypothetical protein
MDYFGINSPSELPKISEILMEELVKATVINDNGNVEENETSTEIAEVIITVSDKEFADSSSAIQTEEENQSKEEA